jgi:myo-inositol 2-dehydrogenase/D-chiro-inositol 1-dehydrogenase
MRNINVGVIGVGRIGSMHTRNLKYQVPGVNVLGVADVFEEAAQKVAQELEIPVAEKDYHCLLENDDIDAVIICSSTDTHAQIISEAAQAGKHIFCEKPIALDIDKIDQAIAVVKNAGIKLQVGFNRRFLIAVLTPALKRQKTWWQREQLVRPIWYE